MATRFDGDGDSDSDKNATVADEVTPASSTGDGGGGSDGDIHDIATFAGEGIARKTTEGGGGGAVEGIARTTESSGPASRTTESAPASWTTEGGGGAEGTSRMTESRGPAGRTSESGGGGAEGTPVSWTTESGGGALEGIARTTESSGPASRTMESAPASWTTEGGGGAEGTSRTTESRGPAGRTSESCGGGAEGTPVSWTTEITEDNGDGGVRGDSEGDSHENVAVEGTPASRAIEITIENEYHSGGVGGGDDSDDQLQSVELIFKGKEVPSWREQLTIRCFVVSFVLGVIFTFVVMKLNLTTGIIPSLNGCAGLLGFFFVKTWIKFVEKCGMLKQPFTRQENTVIQTCVVTTYGIAVSGGFGSYLIGMSSTVANQIIVSNDTQNTKDPSLSWIIGFLFTVSFLGLFTVLPLRKIMIIDYKLIYPGGTSHLINSLHAPQGAKLAKKRLRTLGKFFSFSFLWGFFQWFFTAGDGCGFANFPTFGLKAFENRFYFDFSATYVGVGMICPCLINISVLVGAILSWGLMWPLINNRKGDWYAANISDNSLHGLQAYRVFISIAMILGDGLYNFIKALSRMIQDFMKQYKNKEAMLVTERDSLEKLSNSFDDEVRTKLFLKDQIPLWVSISGYVAVAAVSIGVIPQIFHQMKWYYVVVIYIVAPVLAYCNAYACGLTGWSLASTYGMLAIFAIGAWAGASHGGVLAGLAACGVMMNIVSAASDLMQDFNTGYKTLASPRSMFISQVIGTAMGCVISPCVFWLFYKAFSDLGSLDSEYPAPYALVYRYISVLSVEGFGSLSDHCLTLCYIFFFGAIIINLIRDTVAKKWAKYIPLPMAMAIPFYIGSYFAIDMCFGSLILFIWGKLNKGEADAFGPVVASGLICGDGTWTLLSSLLALARVQPPICMKFLSRGTNSRVDAFLGA